MANPALAVNGGGASNRGYLSLTNAGNFQDLTGGFTVIAAARFKAPTNRERLMDFGVGAGSDNVVVTRLATSNALQFEFWIGNAYNGVACPDAIITNEWHVYAVSMAARTEGQAARVHILSRRNAAVFGQRSGSAPCCPGRLLCGGIELGDGSGFFNGELGYLAIYKSEQTAERIGEISHYAVQSGRHGAVRRFKRHPERLHEQRARCHDLQNAHGNHPPRCSCGMLLKADTVPKNREPVREACVSPWFICRTLTRRSYNQKIRQKTSYDRPDPDTTPPRRTPPMRPSGRAPDQLRSIVLEPNANRYAEGSCLARFGETTVLCTASVDEKVPFFLRGTGKGWITAEYGLLPRATHTRTDREAARGRQSGRTQEIQRLIGRSLRAVTNLKAMSEMQIKIDCDVLLADGGTRTAAITGGYVALHLAFQRLVRLGVLATLPATDQVAAVSCGLYRNVAVLDLDYAEDSSAEVDANFVLTASGTLVEIQGTAEGAPFTREQFSDLLDLAQKGTAELALAQRRVLGIGEA